MFGYRFDCDKKLRSLWRNTFARELKRGVEVIYGPMNRSDEVLSFSGLSTIVSLGSNALYFTLVMFVEGYINSREIESEADRD